MDLRSSLLATGLAAVQHQIIKQESGLFVDSFAYLPLSYLCSAQSKTARAISFYKARRLTVHKNKYSEKIRLTSLISAVYFILSLFYLFMQYNWFVLFFIHVTSLTSPASPGCVALRFAIKYSSRVILPGTTGPQEWNHSLGCGERHPKH